MLSAEQLDEVGRQVRQRRSLSWSTVEKLLATARHSQGTTASDNVVLPVLWRGRLVLGRPGKRHRVNVVAEYFARCGDGVQPRVVVVTDGKDIMDCPASAVQRSA